MQPGPGGCTIGRRRAEGGVTRARTVRTRGAEPVGAGAAVPGARRPAEGPGNRDWAGAVRDLPVRQLGRGGGAAGDIWREPVGC